MADDSYGPLFEGAAAIEMQPIVRRTTVRAHLRRVEGPPLPSNEQLKQEAMDAHELDRVKRMAVEHLRGELVALYHSRDNDPIRWPVPFVNGDDAARLEKQWAHRPSILDTIGGFWRGTIFKKGFARIPGLSHRSLRPDLKGTELPAWRVAVRQAHG